MAKKENILKRIWKRLGQTDVEVTEADVDRILKAEGNPELMKKSENDKPVVKRVKITPVNMKDILPEQNKGNDLGREEK